MKMNQRKIESVLALSAAKRYAHFIKVAADQRKVWGLYANGWALAETLDGQRVFPVWPAREYAELCARDRWSGYVPREIDLDTFFEILIPKLKESDTLAGIFPKPDENGMTPNFSQIESDLRSELARIE